MITDQKRIEEIFARGIVAEILPTREELFNRLLSGERLRIYIGADPTSSALHLSHAKNYMFLEELRRLGHEAIVLFGDFTAQIGDPTDRAATRPQLSAAEIKENVANWLAQIKPLMDFGNPENPPRVLFNSEWLAKLSLQDLVTLAGHFTVQQMIERDMFKQRWDNNTPIYLHEFLYPLMQGYDSVAMDVDVELCGTDQIFNALAGRTLLKRLQHKDKYIIALNLMANPKTGELMSKSKNTGVFLSSPPEEMFGAIMALPDEMIRVLFVNNTRIPLAEVESIMAAGPRVAKARAAFEIVKIFYGENEAGRAEAEFDKTFGAGGAPREMPEIILDAGEHLADRLVASGLVASKGEWRRLVDGGAVSADNVKITSPDWQPRGLTILKIGKRRFVKISI